MKDATLAYATVIASDASNTPTSAPTPLTCSGVVGWQLFELVIGPLCPVVLHPLFKGLGHRAEMSHVVFSKIATRIIARHVFFRKRALIVIFIFLQPLPDFDGQTTDYRELVAGRPSSMGRLGSRPEVTQIHPAIFVREKTPTSGCNRILSQVAKYLFVGHPAIFKTLN